MDQEVEPKKEVDMNQLMERLSKLEEANQELMSSKERLLNESKEWKSKAQKVKEEMELKEQEKAEKEGNFQSLLEMEKNRKHELEQQMKQLKTKTITSNLFAEVSRHANDAYDLDLVVKALPRDLVQIDEENLTVQGVSDAIAMIKKEKPFLFNTHKPTGMVGSRPGIDVPKEKSFSEMSRAEQEEYKKKVYQQFVSSED